MKGRIYTGRVSIMSTRIIICGLNGVGKSTLGRALADRTGYRFIDVEDLYFPKSDPDYLYASPRTQEDVTRLLLDVLQTEEDLVFASVTGKYVENISAYFQYCVIVDAPKDVRMARVKKRSFEKFGERMQPGGDLYEKEQSFYNLIRERKETLVEEWAGKINIPVIHLNGEKPVSENVDFLVRQLSEFQQGMFHM